MAKGNDIDLENISMKKWKCEKKRVNKRKTKIIMGGFCYEKEMVNNHNGVHGLIVHCGNGLSVYNGEKTI